MSQALNILVTGANRGLGIEFVRDLARRGHRVISACRNPADVPADITRLSTRITRLDVAKPADIDRMGEELSRDPGGLDVLINNAGVSAQDGKLDNISWADFNTVFATNAFAPAMLTRAALPALRKGGRKLVLNISSQLGSITNATPGFSYAYCASKAALNMLTARLAAELRPEGLTVVSFCPGWNRTDMGGPQATLDPAHSIPTLLNTALALTPADTGRYMKIDGTTIPW